MEIGILTFPNSPSYGASLQMHGLYRTVEQLGHTPYVINYQNEYMQSKRHMVQNPLRAQILNLISLPAARKFRTFEDRLRRLPAKPIHTPAQLQKHTGGLDYIIAGSDQVWNPAVTGGDTAYFLDFCEDRQKVSYAASFGVDTLEPAFAETVAPLLKKIPSLSIREQQGARLIEQLTDRQVPVVLDPTFLQAGSYWQELAQPHKQVKGEYIFSFIFNPTKENLAFRENLAKQTGLPVVTVSDNPLRRSSSREIFASGVGPREFLGLIRDARYVVTDSFHGTAFSILLNKSFYVSLSTKTNSRLQTLLQSLGLEDRILSDRCCQPEDPDYGPVNGRIAQLRQTSLYFLKTAISGEAEQ